jgi:hypothetical protein
MNHNFASQPNAGESLAALVRAEGSATAPWLRALLASDDPRDATDAMHALCMLYGGHPNLVEAATARSDDPLFRGWLSEATDAFTAERHYLAAVVAAAGPLPSTPNHAQTETALAHQRHALETLARSDRAGCAIGAATALVIDWQAVGPLIDRVATRVGVVPPERRLVDEEPEGATCPGVDRAQLFGARQLIAQQRSLWLLLEARASARER